MLYGSDGTKYPLTIPPTRSAIQAIVSSMKIQKLDGIKPKDIHLHKDLWVHLIKFYD